MEACGIKEGQLEIRSWTDTLRVQRRHGYNKASLVRRSTCWNVKQSHITHVLAPALHYLGIYWCFPSEVPGEPTVTKLNEGIEPLVWFRIPLFSQKLVQLCVCCWQIKLTSEFVQVFQRPLGGHILYFNRYMTVVLKPIVVLTVTERICVKFTAGEFHTALQQVIRTLQNSQSSVAYGLHFC